MRFEAGGDRLGRFAHDLLENGPYVGFMVIRASEMLIFQTFRLQRALESSSGTFHGPQ